MVDGWELVIMGDTFQSSRQRYKNKEVTPLVTMY